ncbi:MAG TPA: tetraacyldisaccharide 4'-kinase [Sphingobacterium sp.]|nr:tetraacyldisaccharide 4'-kinase [Sphingobacterium sp.]
MIRIIRWVLLPFSLIYQLVVWVRNLLYDHGILKSRSFDIPTIVVGNLIIGGTGKSPMTEYLVRLLSPKYNVATLSRGYGRKTKGFREVTVDSTATTVGDEPLQFKRKFPEVTVAVSEDRCRGVDRLKDRHDLIILDDAYQHRKLKPGFSILLFDFVSLQYPALTLPTGNYRDNFSSIKRADLIVITKCPAHLSAPQQLAINHKIRRYTSVPLLYTRIGYSQPIDPYQMPLQEEQDNVDIILFCGIAKPQPLIDYLESKNNCVHPLIFPDHHYFSPRDYEQIIAKYEALTTKHKIILTTEKDFQRIQLDYFKALPFFYIPIHLQLSESEKEIFDRTIESYVSRQRNVN